MLKSPHIILIILCALTASYAADQKDHAPNPTKIRIVPVNPTPEPDQVQLRMVFPLNRQLITSSPSELQMQLKGFPIGLMSNFERRKEIHNDRNGQSVRIIVDERPYFSIYRSFVDTLDDNNIYYDQTLNKKIPFALDRGMHVIRAFPVRSYGESLKDEGCFASSIFFLHSKENNLDVDLSKPFITYNEPQGNYTYVEGKPLLLDFYLSNVMLSKDGFKVRIIIDKKIRRILTAWLPFYIYGLEKGRHTMRLELLDNNNQIVSGFFNNVEKEVNLQ